MDKKTSFNAWYLVDRGAADRWCIQGIWQQAQRTEYLPYSEFETYLSDGKIDDLTITETKIIGTLKDAQEGEPDAFVTTRVDPAFAAAAASKYGVEFRGGSDSNFFTTCSPGSCRSLIFFGIWIFLLRRMAMGGMGVGRPDVDRQEQGQDLRREGHQDHASPTSPASTRPRPSSRRSSIS